MATFAERLKRALIIKEKKQSELAFYTGIDKSSISGYISGRNVPRPEYMDKIAEYLGVSAAWLSGFDVPMDDYSEKDAPVPSDGDLKVALFGGEDEVTDEMWDEVKRFAEFVKTKHKGDIK